MFSWRYFKTRLSIGLIAFLTISSLHLEYFNIKLLSELEDLLYDIRLNITMPNTRSEDIVVIDVDEKSLKRIGQWPWPRKTLAKLVDNLFDTYQIKVLGFDMVFPEYQSTQSLALLNEIEKKSNLDLSHYKSEYNHDMLFAESLIARDVVLGFVFKQQAMQNSLITQGVLPESIGATNHLNQAAHLINHAKSFTGNIELLQQANGYGGFFDYIRQDETLREVPLLQQYQGEIYPSLALMMALISTNQTLQFITSSDGSILTQLKFGNITIPLTRDAGIFVPFRGKLGSFEYISALDVIEENITSTQLNGKIAIIGTSAAGLLDLRSTPVGNSYAGVEVHANAISGILEQRVKHKPDYGPALELVQLFLICLLMTFIYPYLSAWVSQFFLTTLIVFTVIINMYYWQHLNIIFNLASAISLILLLGFFHTSFNFIVAQNSKRHLSRIFGQYIPKQLVNEFDIDEAKLSLSGENRHMSVLFSDVRNFTNISEKMQSQALTKMMNAFLTPITEDIHHHQGTIDKYIGDAVMAFWGAPLNDMSHSDNAISAAFKMLKTTQALEASFIENNWQPLKIGIGINSGYMNVGNMGSSFRVAYTVMGDAVNLASRLESLTKIYGVPILVGEDTKQHSKHYSFMCVDCVRVKGKQKPIFIYYPLLKKEAHHTQFDDALEYYFARNFKKMVAILNEIKQPELEILIALYKERGELFIKTPPNENWDGVFVYNEK